MASLFSTYKFLLDGVQIYPRITDEFSYTWAKQEDSFYFSKKIANDVVLVGDDYDTIDAAASDYKFSFEIQKYTDGAYTTDYEGIFYKTDCNFNADDRKVTFKPTTDDGWDDVKSVLNNSYNLMDLSPISTKTSLYLKPILQIITIDNVNTTTNNKLTNIVGFLTWEETIDGTLDPEDYNFIKVDTGGSSYIYYWRYLTAGGTTRTASDISAISLVYKSILNDSSMAPNIQYWGAYSVDETDYGLAVRCVDHEDEYYYPPTTSAAGSVPVIVNRSEWVCYSIWFIQSTAKYQLEQDNSGLVTIPDSYLVSDIIQLLLSQETDILHKAEANYSEFFYNGSDPVGGTEWNLVITPKSNISSAFYSDPTRTATIRLSEVLAMLEAIKVYWHIEKLGTEKILRLEHVSWYENGGSYGAQIVDIDLTQSYDSRNGLPQSYGQNSFKYNKSDMPERFEFTWQSDTSSHFDGYPIEILSNEVTSGLIETVDNSNYTPDIEAIPAKDNSSLDGFAVIATRIAGSYRIPVYKSIDIIENCPYSVQNGALSFQYLHPNYHGYGMPVNAININEEDTTANSITRNKEQEVNFISDLDINPLHLITTGLGSGQIGEMEYNIVSKKYKITVNHDTE